jgi:hypothetical protein
LAVVEAVLAVQAAALVLLEAQAVAVLVTAVRGQQVLWAKVTLAVVVMDLHQDLEVVALGQWVVTQVVRQVQVLAVMALRHLFLVRL